MPHKDLTARRTYLAARYQRMREGLKAKDVADKAAWIAAGLCSRCGESPPLAGRRYCESCRAKRLAETKRNQRRRMAKNPNTCSTCTLRPATRGRLCMQCYHHAHSKRQNYKQRCADGYGGRCACCGETNIYFLTIDHVDGIANEPRAEFRKRGPTLHARLIRAGFPSGFQCLCMQCNWAKGLHGLCPHNPAFPKSEEGEIVLTPRQQESLKRPAKKVRIRPEKQFAWVREDTP